jgi:hypothetical protein
MPKKLKPGAVVSYGFEPPVTYYISFLDEEAQTASIATVGGRPLVIRHNVPLAELELLEDARYDSKKRSAAAGGRTG